MEQDRAPAVLPHHHELARRPLNSHEVVVQTIAATTTRTGLKVDASLDTGDYPLGIAITATQLQALPITPHPWHGAWNYTIAPPRLGCDHPPAADSTAALQARTATCNGSPTPG